MKQKERNAMALALGLALMEKMERKHRWEGSGAADSPTERRAHRSFMESLTRYRIVERQVAAKLFVAPAPTEEVR